ncbi:MAG TPA: autotransporter domain-containing protein, partial [Allosphingosinicella sp.]
IAATDDLDILLERALEVRSNGGDVTYNGNGSVSTTNDATGLALFTRDLGNIYVGSAATPVSGNFTGRSAVTITQAVSPGGTDPAAPLRDITAYFHGGSFTARPDDNAGVALAISAQDSNVTLIMTGNSVLATGNGVPGGGILVNSELVNSSAAATVRIETDARIGTATAPMHTGIVVFRYFESLGGTDVRFTGTGSMVVTQWGMLINGSEAGSAVSIGTAAGSSIVVAPTAAITDSAGIEANTYLGGNMALDIAGSISGAHHGINARPENGRLDVTIQQGATVSGTQFGLLENRFGGSGPTDILVLGTLSSPQTAADFSGTLRVGNGGTAGTISGNVVNRGTLIFNRSDAVTYGGIVSGAGGLTKAGAGTLTLTGASTYAGGTTIQAGTLQIGNGGTTGSISGNVVDNGTLAFNRSDAVTFAGTVSGTGSLRKQGPGTLTLSGASTYAGGTTVESGTLLVNGSITGATQVNAAGTLGGTGTIGGATIAGTLAPGSGTVGTLNASGNVTFAAGSTFQVEVNENGSSDRLTIAGGATLQGGTVSALFLGGSSGQCGSPITSTILSAQGGVTGTFSGVTANFAFLTPSLSYTANNVSLTLSRNAATFSERGATENQRQAAGAAEALQCGNTLFNALVQLAATPAQSAFEQISGEIHPSARGALLDDSRFVREAMLAARPSRGGWAMGYGSWGSIDGDANVADLDRRSAGLFAGFDIALGSDWSVGVAGGHSRADFDVDARAAEAEVRSWHVAARLGGSFGRFRLAVGGAVAWHEIETSRTIAFTGFSDTPTASYDGRTLQAFAELGYHIPLGREASLEPFAAVALVEVETGTFSENGGPSALTGAEGSEGAGFSTLGLRGRIPLGPLALTGSVGWRHAFGLDPSQTRFAFASSPGTPFTITGTGIADDALALEAGVEIRLGGSARIGLSYSGQIADGSTDHGARAVLSVPF